MATCGGDSLHRGDNPARDSVCNLCLNNDGVFRVPGASGGPGVDKVYSISGVILGIVQAVGMSIAVIILVWLGVKYIMASPDGKAEIKKQAFGYILGAVLLFGASWLVPLLKNVIDGLSS